MSTQPRTARGNRTRAKILAAAEQVFAMVGYHDASIVKITEAAGVGQGTFYLYFESKIDVFDELVDDLNRRVRHAMIEASSQATTRLAAERAGFEAFFRFTAEHPALYRIVRQAEFVSPGALRRHYSRIVEGYMTGLDKARANGEVGHDVDPEVAAWALMGIGEIVGMRWVLWGGRWDEGAEPPSYDTAAAEVPPHVFEQTMQFIERALAAPRAAPPAGTGRATTTDTEGDAR
jgi:AcrR family transcriptional regulator